MATIHSRTPSALIARAENGVPAAMSLMTGTIAIPAGAVGSDPPADADAADRAIRERLPGGDGPDDRHDCDPRPEDGENEHDLRDPDQRDAGGAEIGHRH